MGRIFPTSHLLMILFFSGKLLLIRPGYNIAECLNQFRKVSGRKVSCAKSRVFFSNNKIAEVKNGICNALNITETNDLGTYLGVPTIDRDSSKKEY